MAHGLAGRMDENFVPAKRQRNKMMPTVDIPVGFPYVWGKLTIDSSWTLHARDEHDLFRIGQCVKSLISRIKTEQQQLHLHS
jgi:hypothetical protein